MVSLARREVAHFRRTYQYTPAARQSNPPPAVSMLLGVGSEERAAFMPLA